MCIILRGDCYKERGIIMGEFDFSIDSGQLTTLKGELTTKINEIQSSLDSMESAVSTMSGSDGWESEVYNILNEKFTSRKEALEHAISYLKAYESTIAAVAEKAEELSTQISSACNI